MNNLWSKRIVKLTAGLLLLLSILSFILSYNALRHVADSSGVPGWRSYVWPLLVDGALIVFSLAVLRAAVSHSSERWPWSMVILFTLFTVGFNLVNAEQDWLHWVVAIIPPLALVLSFETLMGMLRSTVFKANQTEEVIIEHGEQIEWAIIEQGEQPEIELVEAEQIPVEQIEQPTNTTERQTNVANSEEQVHQAIERLREQGERLTVRRIADEAGVANSTASRYKKTYSNGRLRST